MGLARLTKSTGPTRLTDLTGLTSFTGTDWARQFHWTLGTRRTHRDQRSLRDSPSSPASLISKPPGSEDSPGLHPSDFDINPKKTDFGEVHFPFYIPFTKQRFRHNSDPNRQKRL